MRKYGIETSIISSNGSRIYHKEFVKQLILPKKKKTILEIIDILEQQEIPMEIHTDRGIFMEKKTELILHFEINRLCELNPIIDKQWMRKQVHVVMTQSNIIFVDKIKNRLVVKSNATIKK